jgi:hypothetical protein
MSMTKNIRHTLIRVGIGALAVLFLLAFMTLAGCTSGTKDIARAAGNTQTLAAGIIAHTEALAPLVAEHEQAASHVKGIAQNARDIQIEAGKVQTALPKVEDKTPWWATALGNLLWLGLGIAAIVLTIKFWPVVAAFLAGVKFLQWLIPQPVRVAAKLDVEKYVGMTPEEQAAEDARITAIRMDPYYAAAWKAEVKRIKLGAKA